MSKLFPLDQGRRGAGPDPDRDAPREHRRARHHRAGSLPVQLYVHRRLVRACPVSHTALCMSPGTACTPAACMLVAWHRDRSSQVVSHVCNLRPPACLCLPAGLSLLAGSASCQCRVLCLNRRHGFRRRCEVAQADFGHLALPTAKAPAGAPAAGRKLLGSL